MDLGRRRFQYYLWGPNSGIGAHNDATYDVDYLNDFPLNYGGFVYEDADNDLKVVAPTRNTLVVNDQTLGDNYFFTRKFPRVAIQIWANKDDK